MAKQFQYWVMLTSWHDGDTFYGVLDQGCHLYYGSGKKPPRFRCALIQAPELETPDGVPIPEGVAALEWAQSAVQPGEYQCISTGLDVYGRPLLDLLTDHGWYSDMILAAGHAAPYKR